MVFLVEMTETHVEESAEPTLAWTRRFGEHIEVARTRALLSRAELATRLGVAEESIRRWERGGARPSPDSLARLIVVLALDGAKLTSLPVTATDVPQLARLLQQERAQRNVTQARAGEILGVAQATYAGWEIGRATPAAQFLPPIGAFLGLSAAEVTELVSIPFTVDGAGWPAFGQLLGARREALRLTRDELARMLGVAAGTIVAWELGHRSPRAPQLRALAAAVEVSVEALAAALPQREAQLSALGELIRSRQRRLGLRRSDIADRAGLDEATISRWVHGHHTPEQSSLRRLAAAIEVPFDLVCRVASVSP
jgi:transcriptional regulator with XRE-family HTH domain